MCIPLTKMMFSRSFKTENRGEGLRCRKPGSEVMKAFTCLTSSMSHFPGRPRSRFTESSACGWRLDSQHPFTVSCRSGGVAYNSNSHGKVSFFHFVQPWLASNLWRSSSLCLLSTQIYATIPSDTVSQERNGYFLSFPFALYQE